MTTTPTTTRSRALVLGGGGVTGIAWEVGVLAGLHAAGVDLTGADAVIGTSAGAFVGAALASGHDLEALFAAQSQPDPNELPAAATEQIMAAWYAAFTAGGTDPQRVGAAMGPKARGGKSKSEAAYIRFLHEGTARTARLYLNSIAAYMQGIGERGFCAPLPGADIQPNGDVYFYFGGTKTEQVIDVAGKLRGWSNNAPDAS